MVIPRVKSISPLLAALLALGAVQADTGRPTPYTMTGVVVNSAGQPVQGAEVFADNTLYYNMNALATTDAKGRYTIKLPKNEQGTWAPGATVKRKYHGVTYEFRLYADNNRAFSASDGAVRKFTWRLSGELPDGDGFIGQRVFIYGGTGITFGAQQRVEVTLTPDGPLVDGSPGKPITRVVEEGRITDVPLGRYRATARILRSGQPPLPLLVSPGQGGNYAASATADFEKTYYGITMEFTVRMP
jgi:hypothetical protein